VWPLPEICLYCGRADASRRGDRHVACPPARGEWIETSFLVIVPVGGLVVPGFSPQQYFVR
jgi:hypothetical protein